MTEGARDSHFHLIFGEAPIVVGKYVDGDLPSLFVPFNGHVAAIDQSAQRELMQQTGGVPLLTVAVLGQVYKTAKPGDTIRQAQITEAATHIVDARRDVMKALWDDCCPEMQSDLVALQDRDVRRDELSQTRQDDHVVRGFAAISGGSLKLKCRMMGVFSKRQNAGMSDVKRLFGEPDRYQENIRALLEVRRDQIARQRMATIDPDLFNLVQSAVTHVRDPMTCTIFARRIRNRALHLIWATELPGNRIPPNWLTELGAGWTDIIPARVVMPFGSCRLQQACKENRD